MKLKINKSTKYLSLFFKLEIYYNKSLIFISYLVTFSNNNNQDNGGRFALARKYYPNMEENIIKDLEREQYLRKRSEVHYF